ncbi:4'-phosphopantetheinyl transferase family protein [Acinetobacter pseudolwoffii]|uniref:4'-phosphopantetheinyl transferase family protein n=1 Tax=Acinetobacter pseudolwoffii TaxID=2053287 RepID=UPI0025775C51|nr:4'-phosphopantetheinyl transferase superfamily protein [Acinetobacter pseudolwoffii]MDM1322889.1 4'-phosphopantetheinyl transferase superfamily protein [Acinetobacter pseudolwoffii]
MTSLIQIDLHRLSDSSQRSQIPDRKAQLAARKLAIAALRNWLLSRHLQVAILDQDVVRSTFGKPYLFSYPDFSFNHSHSQNFYALATSHQVQNLGVDIEELGRKVRFEALAQHAFHPEELKQWQALDYDPEYWFKVWTTKEAVLKASGLGIRISLKELNTRIHSAQNGGRCEHPEIGVYAYQNYNLAGCMLTVAWQSEHSCKGFKFPVIQIQQSV